MRFLSFVFQLGLFSRPHRNHRERNLFPFRVRPRRGAKVRRRERRETEHSPNDRGGKANANDMKEIILLLILCTAGGGYLWYRADCAKQERRERTQRQQNAERRQREAEQRAEDERVRKERTAAVAKEDAVKLFVRYVRRRATGSWAI